MKKDISCLVLGIGNILWADEGFGVRAVEKFHEKWVLTEPNALICDGGTLGMYLFDLICRTRNLLIFDCCDFGEDTPEVKVLRDDEITVWASTKISPHQTGMNDLLASALLKDAYPEHISVIGIQPIVLDDYGGSLSPTVKEKIKPAVQMAYEELKNWNIAVRARLENEKINPLINVEGINLENYEKFRPQIGGQRAPQTRLNPKEY